MSGRVTVKCDKCGVLYTSQEIKAGAHRDNAVAKAGRLAKAHSNAEPDHIIEVDPWGNGPIVPAGFPKEEGE